MIGKYENSKTLTGNPFTETQITSAMLCTLFISDRDFYFADEDTFEAQSNWITAIKNRDVHQIIKLKESEDQSEPDQYIKSDLDYEYFYKTGKYQFIFKAPYRLDYHQNLANWSGKPMRIFLGDINKNVYAMNNSGQVRGFDVELFHVEKKSFSFGTVPAWTTIKIRLAFPEEYDETGLCTKMDWNPNKTSVIFCTISSITGTGSTLTFTVTDSVHGIYIEGLTADDFSIDDDENTRTVSSLAYLGDGQYTLTASGSVAYGTITIDADDFYSSDTSYFVTTSSCVISNIVWSSEHIFTCEVAYSGSGSPVTGMDSGDFTVTDDVEGVCTITDVTETPSGTYQVTCIETLTTGDIDVDDGSVTGTAEYDLVLQVEFSNFGNSATHAFQVDIDLIGGSSPVTGLADTDFTITDELNGVLAITDFDEPTTGTYTFILDKAKTNINVVLSNASYEGEDDFDCNLDYYILNGGGSGTTDFVDAGGGIPTGFGVYQDSYCDAEIITDDPYMEGNSFQIQKTSGAASIQVGFYCNPVYFKFNTAYKIRVKYRTTSAGTGADRFTKLILNGAATNYINEDMDVSGTYWSWYTSEEFTITNDTQLELLILFTKLNMIILVDTVEIIEV